MSSSLRFAIFLSVVMTFWTVENLYVGWRLLSLPVFTSAGARWSLIGILGVGFAGTILSRFANLHAWPRAAAIAEFGSGLWLGVIFLLMAALIAADIVTVAGLAFTKWVIPVRTAAVGLGVIGIVAACIGGAARPRIVQIDAPIDGLRPGTHPIRLLQISDLHLGAMAGRTRVRTVLDLIDETAPDVIAVTGDLVDRDLVVTRRLLPELRRIHAPLGVFAVLGNHEYYNERGPQASRELIAEAGFRLLENTSVELAEGVWLAGVPDDASAGFRGHPRADLDMTLAGVPSGAGIVLLQHTPGREAEAAGRGVDVMLNGHTHGGQVWPFHLLVRRSYGHIGGVRRIGSMLQVVSRGAGLWGPPMRLFAPADVVLLTLRPAVGD